MIFSVIMNRKQHLNFLTSKKFKFHDVAYAGMALCMTLILYNQRDIDVGISALLVILQGTSDQILLITHWLTNGEWRGGGAQNA